MFVSFVIFSLGGFLSSSELCLSYRIAYFKSNNLVLSLLIFTTLERIYITECLLLKYINELLILCQRYRIFDDDVMGHNSAESISGEGAATNGAVSPAPSNTSQHHNPGIPAADRYTLLHTFLVFIFSDNLRCST